MKSHKFFRIMRLPLDFCFLTVHYFKGIFWLFGYYLKKLFGIETKGWPFGCFTTKTTSGRSACIPARKYGNLFLFRALCPDAACKSDEKNQFYCRRRIKKTRSYWRPANFHIIGVGILLIVLWSSLGFGIYELSPSSKHKRSAKVSGYLATGKMLFQEGEYNKAYLAFKNAIQYNPGNVRSHFELGKCLLRLNRVPEAFETLSHVLEVSPRFWEAHLELARLTMKKGYFHTAIRYATEVTDINPEFHESYLILAFCLGKQGKFDQAKQALEKGVDRLPEDDTTQIEFAAELYSLIDDTEQANKFYLRALELDPNSVNARIGLGDLLVSLGQLASAAEQYERVLSNHPQNKEALISRAELYIVRGEETRRVINEYEEIIRLYPDDPHPQTRLASILYFKNQKEKATEILQTVVAEHPNYSDALLSLSEMHLERNRYRLAAVYAKKVEKSEHEKFIAANQVLARSYVGLKEYNKAINSATIVLDFQPDEFPLKTLLAFCYHQVGEKDKAIALYKEAGALNPNSFLPDVYLGTLFSESNEIDAAISSYKRALTKFPGDKKIANNLAMFLLERGGKKDIEEALHLAKGLVQHHADNPIIKDTLGWAHYHRGDYQKAEEVLNNVIKISPKFPDAYYHLGKTLLQQNNLVRAEKLLTKSLTLAKNFKGAADAESLLREIQEQLQQEDGI